MRSKRRRELKKKVALLGIVTPQSNLRFASSPAGEPLVRFTNSYVKPALKGEVDMSVSEWTEGL